MCKELQALQVDEWDYDGLHVTLEQAYCYGLCLELVDGRDHGGLHEHQSQSLLLS